MKAYGLKNKIRDGGRKVRSHENCGICHNFKVNKTSTRMQIKRFCQTMEKLF